MGFVAIARLASIRARVSCSCSFGILDDVLTDTIRNFRIVFVLYVFVLPRILRSRFHGHEHVKCSPLRSFEQPASPSFSANGWD
jgi:hypothetical protein